MVKRFDLDRKVARMFPHTHGAWVKADEVLALQIAVQNIVDTYDAYRRRGLNPAPLEYADVVKSIESARKALEQKK